MTIHATRDDYPQCQLRIDRIDGLVLEQNRMIGKAQIKDLASPPTKMRSSGW
ncbi:hypothetical protein [Mycobacteroides saopaulense]|uniref:hypothetical protein n=1 Tax=Mycobacteroides saopaulense TaxID=1578165 RepID=UPI0013F4E150|nr:hypothetical protein [Mycobacteroides saopaulense]